MQLRLAAEGGPYRELVARVAAQLEAMAADAGRTLPDGLEDVCTEFRVLAELISEVEFPVHDDRESVARYDRRSTYLFNWALQHIDELWRVVYGRGTGITPGRCLDVALENLATAETKPIPAQLRARGGLLMRRGGRRGRPLFA